MAKGRNPGQGRHLMGSPIAKSGIKPPVRTGSPSGYFVGTGVNRKSAATPQHKPSRSAPAQNYTRQAEQFAKQSPEPFRNPSRAANPMIGGVPIDRQAGSTRAQGRGVMSQADMNRFTGHDAGYQMKGLTATTSGFPRQGQRQAGNPLLALKPGWQTRTPKKG